MLQSAKQQGRTALSVMQPKRHTSELGGHGILAEGISLAKDVVPKVSDEKTKSSLQGIKIARPWFECFWLAISWLLGAVRSIVAFPRTSLPCLIATGSSCIILHG